MFNQNNSSDLTSEIGSILSMLGAGAWVYDTKANNLICSTELYKILEIEEHFQISKELLYERCSDLDKSKLHRSFELCNRRGKEFDIIIQFSSFGGENLWLNIIGKANIKAGEVINSFGVLKNISSEIHAKEIQKKNEEFFQGILETTNGWLWEVNEENVIVYASSRIKNILGYEPSEVIGKTPFDFMRPEKVSQWMEEVNSYKDKFLPLVDLNVWNVTKSGRDILLNVNAIPIFDLRGKFKGYKGIVEDHTATHLLQERNHQRDLLLKDMKVGKWEYDSLSDQLLWNQAMYELLELDTSEEPSFLSFVNLIHPDDRISVKEMYQSAYINLSSLKVIHRLVFSDGRERWVRSEVRSFANTNGSIRTLGYMQDVSEIRKLEEELVSQKSYLESILSSLDASAIVSITDRRGRIIKVNNEFCKISGYKEEELIGKTHHLVNSGYHPKEFMRNLRSTINKGKRWRGEILNRSKTGETYWVDTIINPVFNLDGKIIQFLSIRNLITKQKEMNAELEKERKELTSALDLINKQIDFAESLQKYLLPKSSFCQENSVEVAIINRPVDKVSGDIYDFFAISKTKCRFFIADATGHGLTAGFQTMFIQTEYQRIKDVYRNPATIIDCLNQSIWKTFPNKPIYYTCCIIDIDMENKKITFCNAAQPEPILQIGDELILLEPTSPIMGLLKDHKASYREISIEDPFRLILYSDGITETHNQNMELFNLDFFVEFIQNNRDSKPKDFIEKLESTLDYFREGKPSFDDMTLLVADFETPD